MNLSSPQLPLGISPRDGDRFDNFFVGENALLVELARNTAEVGNEPQIGFWGLRGVGKSHLLNAICRCADACGRTAVYLPLSQLIEQPVDVVSGMENFDIIAVDEVDSLVDHREWQNALFNLINRARQTQASIMTASLQNPSSLPLLPDLVSRLVWGPVLRLLPPRDHQLAEAVGERAKMLGLSMESECVNFLLTRHSRKLGELYAALNLLDRSSLVEQRRLTIPFIKSVLMPD